MTGPEQLPSTSRVTVLALDRWGRVLVVVDTAGARPPSGELDEAESPDTGALRVFEAATGALLDELKLLRLGEKSHHVYYCDPDLGVSELTPAGTVTLRYLAPDEIESGGLTAEAQSLLTKFVTSSAYRAMFH